jgi:hypothetical protein
VTRPPEGRWPRRALVILGLLTVFAVIVLVPLSHRWIDSAASTPSLQPGDGVLVLQFEYVPQASTTSGLTASLTVTPSPAEDPLSVLSAQRLSAPARASLQLPAGSYQIDGSTQDYGPGPSGFTSDAPLWTCTKVVTLTDGQTLTVSMTYDIGTCTLVAR